MSQRLRDLLNDDLPLCSSGHRPFPTAEAAQAALRGAQYLRLVKAAEGTQRHGDVEKGTYHCKACGCWHLTSNTSRQDRAGHQRRRTDRRRT